MSAQALALAASKATQDQITALGGAVPNLTDAANAAVAEHLKKTLDAAKDAAVTILQGYTSYAGNIVAEGNKLAREVEANNKKQAEAARAHTYFQATGNIFPLRKLIGMPTPRDILDQYPGIDEIARDWAPAAAAPAAAAATS